jgi:hypothetical protein
MSPHISGDASRMSGLNTAERAQAVENVIQAILTRFPQADRARVEASLRNEGTFGFGTDDPELARYYAVLADARAVVAAEMLAARGTTVDRELSTARVTVAITERLSVTNARAIVRLWPEDHGVPVLLLPDGKYTGMDVRRGLRAASILLKRYEHGPAKRVQLVLRGGSRASATRGQFEKYLPLLREAAPRSIVGIGPVRALDIRVGRGHPTTP